MTAYNRLNTEQSMKILHLMFNDEVQKYIDYVARVNNMDPITLADQDLQVIQNIESEFYSGLPGCLYNAVLNRLQLNLAKTMSVYKPRKRRDAK